LDKHGIIESIVVAGLQSIISRLAFRRGDDIIVGDRTTIQGDTDAVASLAQLKSAAPLKKAARLSSGRWIMILPDQ